MRKIIHIDMDCFYAAIEERDNPELRGRAVAVGGYHEGRGVITTANNEARKYGVRSALASAVALRRCPHLVLVRPDLKKYAEVSRQIRKIFEHYSEKIEPLSLDEAYLDVSGSTLFQGSASLLAAHIREEIFKKTGLKASAGIAPNKFLAKVASDWNKPDGQFVVTPEEIDEFVARLPVEKIWGVGKVTAKKVHELGAQSCGDLQKFSRKELKGRFGKFGDFLYEICRGVDHREVDSSRERKSLSVERTFTQDIDTPEECLEKAPRLYEEFLHRLFRKKVNHDQDATNEKTLAVREKESRYGPPDATLRRFPTNSAVEKNTAAPVWPGADTETGATLDISQLSFEKIRHEIKTLFVKVKFNDFSATTVERAFDSLDLKHFQELLAEGLDRKELPVRLIGLGVRFRPEPSPAPAVGGQLLLFEPPAARPA